MKKFYIIYEIKNKLNGKKYIGCHMTDNLDDGYMGSGKYLKRAIDKYGMDNFEKSILFLCENEKDMLNKESELVNESIVNSEEFYNISLGGGSNFSHINNNLEKYKHHFENKVVVNDNNGNKISINRNDERWINGSLKAWNVGNIICSDKNGRVFIVKDNDERWINGDLNGIAKNKHLFKNVKGECFLLNINDERIKNENLESFWRGYKHSDESKKKIGEKNSIKQKGEKNSQYGTCWVFKEGISKKVKKIDIEKYINSGWIKGRKMK